MMITSCFLKYNFSIFNVGWLLLSSDCRGYFLNEFVAEETSI